MSTKLRVVMGASALVGVLAVSPAFAAQWQNKVSYGGSTVMDLYVPDSVDPSPAVVVSLHYCGGSSSNAHGWFQSFADQYGFVIITPSAGGNCFDASPSRSGERDAITKMVSYVVAQHQADTKRVFAAGASSGACMTNALLAAYPDVFAAGATLAAVPAGAWTGGNAYGWNTPAGRTAQQWGDIVRMAHPGYTGPRPRVQIWFGTADTTLNYEPNFAAQVAQWTNVLGVSDANATKSTFQGSQDMWARTTYKDASGTAVLETNVANGAPHDLSGRGLWRDVVRFFGLDMDPSSGTGGGGAGGGGAGGAAGSGAGGAAAGSAGASNVGGSSAVGGTSSGGQPPGGGSASGGAGGGGAGGSGGITSAAGTAGAPGGGAPSGAAGSASAGAPPANSGDGGGGCSVRGPSRPSAFALLALCAAWLVRRRISAAT